MTSTRSLHSMTGFVSYESVAITRADDASKVNVNIELRSLNARYLELHFRLPDELRHVEALFRRQISALCARGKIEVRITLQIPESRKNGFDNRRLMQLTQLLELQKTIRQASPDAPILSVDQLLQRCLSSPATLWSEGVEKDVLTAFTVALDQLVTARESEGQALKDILQGYLEETRAIVATLTLDLTGLQTRLLRDLQQKADKLCAQLQQTPPLDLLGRLQTELMHHLINGDVAEELTRLNVHLNVLQQLIKDGGVVGKKADFLMQELNREANTLGAKASVLEISQVALELKVKIDQMREQFQNIQ